MPGQARLLSDHEVEVQSADGPRRLVGAQILIATGSQPSIPSIPGLADVPYLTSDLLTSGESMELKFLPKSLLIIGGGYTALELGQMFHRFGTKVTLLERSEALLRGYEPEVRQAIGEIFRAEGIDVGTQASIREIRTARAGITVKVALNGKEREFRAERLLMATGRRYQRLANGTS